MNEAANAEQEERFRAYLDGELDDGARQALEAELAADAALAAAFARYRETVAALQQLAPVEVPARFGKQVERRIRRRSRGRYFASRVGGGFPFEAVMSVLAMAGVLAYAFSFPRGGAGETVTFRPRGLPTSRVLADPGHVRAALAAFGPVVEPAPAVYRLTLPAAALPALERVVRSLPGLHVVGRSPGIEPDQFVVDLHLGADPAP